MRCAEVWRPSEFSGLKMLSVVTVDLTNGLPPTDVETVMSGGKIVYGSATGLYVGTERWISPLAQGRAARGSTAIHKFDIATPNETDYAASGRVPGFMLSQWSLSEHDGFLRVASTTDPPWLFRRPARSESFVTVLEQEGDRLRRAGQVGGLGRGERIFAVRFMGDIGYVVTFRQVDPLYTLDLADPSEPFKAGKLKIPGYSAYLHPIGEDRLLGIGQSATRRGTLLGTQISLFDVSDLSNPTRLDRLRFAGGSSLAEFDHHAFLYWEPEQLAVLPIQIRSRRDWSLRYTSARGFRIGDDGGIQKVASIRHGARDMDPVTRTLVVGGRLFTLSERGLKATNLDTFAEEAWIHFKVGRKRR
jgi:hypothetical protein